VSTDDPLDPKRWTARGGEGGPITGDELAYLKDIIAERMGVGNWQPDPFAERPAPAPPPTRWERLKARLWRR
jgi:hypothetical protein